MLLLSVVVGIYLKLTNYDGSATLLLGDLIYVKNEKKRRNQNTKQMGKCQEEFHFACQPATYNIGNICGCFLQHLLWAMSISGPTRIKTTTSDIKHNSIYHHHHHRTENLTKLKKIHWSDHIAIHLSKLVGSHSFRILSWLDISMNLHKKNWCMIYFNETKHKTNELTWITRLFRRWETNDGLNRITKMKLNEQLL